MEEFDADLCLQKTGFDGTSVDGAAFGVWLSHRAEDGGPNSRAGTDVADIDTFDRPGEHRTRSRGCWRPAGHDDCAFPAQDDLYRASLV